MRGKNAEQKLAFAQKLAKEIQKVANKLHTDHSEELIENIRSLKKAISEASYGDRRKIAERKSCETKLGATIKKIALEVEKAANGNDDFIRSVGFDVRRTNNKPSTLKAPSMVNYARTKNEGEIMIKWKPVNNSRSYVLEIRELGRKTWNTEFSTKSRFLFNGLKPGKQFEVRVKAIGAKGLSKSSQSCTFMAA